MYSDTSSQQTILASVAQTLPTHDIFGKLDFHTTFVVSPVSIKFCIFFARTLDVARNLSISAVQVDDNLSSRFCNRGGLSRSSPGGER